MDGENNLNKKSGEMKRVYLLSICLAIFNIFFIQAQKPSIDTAAINDWRSIGKNDDVLVSSNGKYFSYSIRRGPYTTIKTVVQSTESSWKREYPYFDKPFFSEDGKQFVTMVNGDLCFSKLGTDELYYERSVASVRPKDPINSEWIAYQLTNNSSTVIVKNLVSGKEKRYDNADSYSFDGSGKWLLCELKGEAKDLALYDLKGELEKKYTNVTGYTISGDGNVLALKTRNSLGKLSMEWVEIDGGRKTIWQADRENVVIGSISFDISSTKLLFTINENKGKEINNEIWYYKNGMDRAVLKVKNETPGTDGLRVTGGSFSKVGQYILFSLQEPLETRQIGADKSRVDIWNYRDAIIQSVQLYKLGPKTYFATIRTDGRNVVRLQYEYEALKNITSDYAIITGKDFTGDRFWEPSHKKDSNWLVKFSDGSRFLLPLRGPYLPLNVSPDGRYVVFCDPNAGFNYFSYDLLTGKLHNISASMPPNLLTLEMEYDKSISIGVEAGMAGWLENEAAILVYDNYDIWQLDLEGKRKPVNITNGFGRKNKKILRFANGHSINCRNFNDDWLLSVYDPETKYNGFYKLKVGKDPRELLMGPYCFFHAQPSSVQGSNDFDAGMAPLKATNANVWIIKRQSATEAPNYFVTTDFKTYKTLTDLKPQTEYNWLSAELVSFRQIDGTKSQGILYKPENFDPAKKYPVIINYYRFFSQRLFQYPYLDYLRSAFPNVAWFVSRGYLVFTPDLYLSKRGQGYDGFNSVEGAAMHLSTFPFVDSNRMAICGHSNGGSISMYLLTHSHRFAAVFAGAIPATDRISHALGLMNPNADGQINPMAQDEEIRGPIWNNPEVWYNDNPVMRADKVTMPLLIYHGLRDDIPFLQPVEMFLALRRLNKPVWMLNYNESGHGTGPKRDAVDLTMRVTQYFDHYLKGVPPPLWMSSGVLAKLKQIESRYELDPNGTCGAANCQACHKNKITKTK